MTIEQIVGARIRALRKRNGLTQEELAERAGIAAQTISRAERGRALSIANIKSVAGALGVNPLDLFATSSATDAEDGNVQRVVALIREQPREVQILICRQVDACIAFANSLHSSTPRPFGK